MAAIDVKVAQAEWEGLATHEEIRGETARDVRDYGAARKHYRNAYDAWCEVVALETDPRAVSILELRTGQLERALLHCTKLSMY